MSDRLLGILNDIIECGLDAFGSEGLLNAIRDSHDTITRLRAELAEERARLEREELRMCDLIAEVDAVIRKADLKNLKPAESAYSWGVLIERLARAVNAARSNSAESEETEGGES